MRRLSLGGIAASLLVAVSIGLAPQHASAQNQEPHGYDQRDMDRATEAEPVGPSALADVQGIFRVKGKVRKKTAGFTYCNCEVNFYHDNLVGGDYYSYRRTAVKGNKCNMNVPFRFQIGDTGRPVVVSMEAYCGGDDNLYRYFSADLPDIPLKSGNSKIVEFDVDM